MVRGGQSEIADERARHHVVVMLTRVDEHLPERRTGAKRVHQRRDLHVVRSGTDDVDDRLHLIREIRWY